MLVLRRTVEDAVESMRADPPTDDGGELWRSRAAGLLRAAHGFAREQLRRRPE
jgi:hypothetical protein